MRISALILLAAFGIGSGSAAAADLIVDDPEAIAAAADYDWSGAYAGLFLGAGNSDVRLTEPGGLADPLDLAAGGWLAGVRAGFNAQAGMLVFGAEADLAKTWIGGDDSTTVGPNSLDYSYDIDWLGTVTGRLGYAADTLLLYAKGGLAAGGVRSTLTPPAPLPAPPPESADAVATGWTIGLGTEFAFSENVTAGIEYDFVSLASELDYSSGSLDAQQDLHIVKLGVNYGF
ncbi:MAG TPA: outer membrane beta-barrel protein [Devosia sp.]|uniref:outer membrane protein n=1 Tax=Devosia sp. TaxID=1871048 RepID=UPI002DDCA189|nr:outer membrane beta-barrel protein [Devosia sp.]HEV2516030.1 outer membrane beta-barrel protein [Devosia sp.]